MFRFKKFEVEDGNCAMKVGTDGVLLGALADISRFPNTILDIGTGCGIVALMLAQRTDSQQIDGVEIDELAFEQAVSNFENSPWSDRLFCYHAGFSELVADPDVAYDLIVCNPPFFSENYFSDDERRNLARFSEALPLSELVNGAAVLMSQEGIFVVIIPFLEEAVLIDLAAREQLFPYKICRIKGNEQVAIKRSVLHFCRNFEGQIEYDALVIEISRHHYTSKYVDLTKDFYVNM